MTSPCSAPRGPEPLRARLRAALTDRRTIAAAFAAILGGLGWEFSPALRDALWALWTAVLGGG